MDLKVLAEKVDLEESEYQEMMDLFLTHTAEHLQQLKVAIETGNRDQVIQTAHSIKGSAATLGLTVISGIARGVEINARQNNLNGAERAVQAIQAEIEQIAQLVSASPVSSR